MTKKDLLETLKNETIEKNNYDLIDYYTGIYNACVDYGNETQDWQFDDFFNDFVDYDTCEMLAKQTLEQDGLIRLYYFLGDANFNNNLFRINGYGNLVDIYTSDIDDLKDSIIYELENQLAEGEDDE